MRDSQSDWESIYSDLNNMSSEADPFMSEDSNKHLVSDQQINHAKLVLCRLKKQAFKSLNGIKNLNSQDKRALQVKIDRLIDENQIHLQTMNNENQVDNLVHKIHIHLTRMILIRKFNNFIYSMIFNVHRSSLTESQQLAAISELRINQSYTEQDLRRSQTIDSLRNSIFSGKNSANGALIKYVTDSQINISHQLKMVADRVRHQIEIQPNLNITAKYLAYQKISMIKTNFTTDLTNTNQFSDLERIKRQGIQKFKSVLSDKTKILTNLTQFNRFIAKIKAIINEISGISPGDKLHLSQKLDHYQKMVENKAQQHDFNSNHEFTYQEHHVSIAIIRILFKMCRQRISNLYLKLAPDQRIIIDNKLDQVINSVDNRLRSSYLKSSIEDNLVKSLKHLELVTNKIDRIIYKDQVRRLINNIDLKIKDTYNLSVSNKHYLRSQIDILGKHLLHNQTNETVESAHHLLNRSFHKKVRYMMKSSLDQSSNSLHKQIQASHLPADQKHRFLVSISKICHKKVSYESKRFLIKDVLGHSLVSDKNENLQRMTKLSEELYRRVNSLDIASRLNGILRRNLIGFSQRINDADRLSIADQEEQQFENLAYRKLCQLYDETDSLRARYLDKIVMNSRKLHNLIDSAILDMRVRQQMNDRVSKIINMYIYKILSINDVNSLKHQTPLLIKDLQHRWPRIINYLQKTYVNQVNRFCKQLNQRLDFYSIPWSTQDRVISIQSRIVGRIRASSNPSKIEYAKQLGIKQVNDVVSHVTIKIDHHKKVAIHQITALNKSIRACLDRIKNYGKQTNYRFLNQVLNLVNRAEYHLDWCPDVNVDTNVRHYIQISAHVLRQGYLHEWLLITRQAYVSVEAMDNIPKVFQLKFLQAIQNMKLEVTSKLKKCQAAKLGPILQSNHHQIQQLVIRSVYLDPIKGKIRQDLTQLIGQIRSQVSDGPDLKSIHRYLARLNKLSNDVDDHLRQDDDAQAKQFYKIKKSALKAFQIKFIRKTQLNKFIKYTHQFNDQLDRLNMLAEKELQMTHDHFNHRYHKAVYLISHASSRVSCKKCEQQSEKVIQKILVKDREIDASKRKFYKALAIEVKSSKNGIRSLKGLQKKDKQDSTKLLNQIKHQTYLNIKESLSRNQMIKAKGKCYQMIKQVVDKVSSANVLVAAIKSANNQISSSALDRKQKDATLKQINRIIDSGIHSQFDNNKENELQTDHQDQVNKQDLHDDDRHVDSQRHKTKDINRKMDDFDIDKDTDYSLRKKSWLSSIITNIKNFFRWLRFKLASVL